MVAAELAAFYGWSFREINQMTVKQIEISQNYMRKQNDSGSQRNARRGK